MIEKHLDFLSSAWNVFPTYSFYYTSSDNTIMPKNAEKLYVYSLHKVKNPVYKEVPISSICFRLFSFHIEGMREPVGFAILSTLPKGYFIRYTPLTIVATNSRATKEVIEKSDRIVAYNNSWIELVKISECGVEILTDLGHKLDVYLGMDAL